MSRQSRENTAQDERADGAVDFGPWSRAALAREQAPALLLVGDNPTRLFGLTPAQRLARIAARRGLQVVDEPPVGRPAVLAHADFVFDPVLLDWTAARPGRLVALNGRAALACAEPGAIEAVRQAMAGAGPLPSGFDVADCGAPLFFRELFKSEPPLLAALSPSTRPAVERAAYQAAYRGVSDVLTLHLWKGLAFHLVRAAAALRLTPNAITLAGLVLCVAAGLFFWRAAYWPGLACAFGFMVLDTVDGKLARCTVASSRFGDILDHGVDIVHPPLWWWAWRHGLGAASPAVDIALLTIIAAYAAQRCVESIFLLRFGMQIHLWRPFDSRAKLITAQRNIQVLILLGFLLVGRPGEGLIAVAAWTAFWLCVHSVRLVQALQVRRRGGAVTSWLARA